ncbi:UDP-3-O-(3-hydroxymyristoyl)glucosamine N-acyltransferase [Wenxinia marina]|uniref:UDP-3-O-acylglucosamine N-acyltransferase n=1 Tax=Wenxinia marina DSM 24838 TaxID=1123501 RepID=A0A0D0Q8S4_9RHOB|nr:UDP-3-O-(3-hydroxymyristoyl)glucosamine N-acyltransferase [Wenxinia marina]KIQ68757.1 UDP-3-O-[3-hydroxymyristoyl] glucosamine N-acyltransferase [Wenxinia marina DSM 24838]GGL65401.1 UDP-3-O-(3-hydroxymyristoyl)glucosamine N-acyltransferase [Wenxinia marina]
MPHTIAEIAAALGAEVQGDGEIKVTGAAEPASARPDQLALALSPDFAAGLSVGQARAAIVWPGADWQAMGLAAAIFAPRARLAMARLTQTFAPGDAFGAGVHPSAVIEPSARIGADVVVGPFTYIAANAEIGAGSRLGAHVTVGQGARIGPFAAIRDGARIGPRVVAGARLVVQPGAVIGSDGFSYVTEAPSGPERAKRTRGAEPLAPTDPPEWHKIESLGGVLLGDDVEIGANATIDAGTIRPTSIGDGTKLDNLVHVGHNVTVGRHCLLCGQVGIAGSASIGDRVVLGGQAGVADHVTIGDDVVAGGGAGIISKVASGSVVFGYPAERMDRAFAGVRALRRLVRTGQKPVPKDPPSE